MRVGGEFLVRGDVVGAPVEEVEEAFVYEPGEEGGVEEGLPHCCAAEDCAAAEGEELKYKLAGVLNNGKSTPGSPGRHVIACSHERSARWRDHAVVWRWCLFRQMSHPEFTHQNGRIGFDQ